MSNNQNIMRQIYKIMRHYKTNMRLVYYGTPKALRKFVYAK